MISIEKITFRKSRFSHFPTHFFAFAIFQKNELIWNIFLETNREQTIYHTRAAVIHILMKYFLILKHCHRFSHGILNWIVLVRTLVFLAMMRCGNKIILFVNFKFIPNLIFKCFDDVRLLARSLTRLPTCSLVSSEVINKSTREHYEDITNTNILLVHTEGSRQTKIFLIEI